MIALGAFTVADHRLHEGLRRSKELDELLQPRVYFVEYPRNIFGKFRPIVTQINELRTNYATLLSSHLEILEPCWII